MRRRRESVAGSGALRPRRRAVAGSGALWRIVLIALLALVALPAAAQAHPLGNFSINHLAEVAVSRDGVAVHYILDQAEIPTFQERGLSRAEVLRRKRDEVVRGLALTVDGMPVPLVPAGPGALALRPGQGGLRTTRATFDLHARAHAPRRVVLRDDTFRGRVGWKAIRAVPGRGTAVRSSVAGDDPTHGLTSYPRALLSTPSDVRAASFAVAPGAGTVTSPGGRRYATTTDRSGGTAGFAGLLEDHAAGGVLVLLLLAAFGWGALHALSPGHGKTMVAAYLIGTRGRPRDAVTLGITVTVAHTIGVFALGIVTLALSVYVLPEDLYPWLNLASGVMVLAVGAAVLRARVRDARGEAGSGHGHGHSHGHGPSHSHDHGNADGQGHSHGHGHGHGQANSDVHAHGHSHGHGHADGQGHSHSHGHTHGHGHSHGHGRHPGRRGIIAMGASAGLIPCPTALVVLLGAIAQHEVALGLLLILAFSAGLATTLTVLGVLVVKAARLPVPGRIAVVLPALSALAIVGLGLVLTLRAVPQIAG